jgi:hypothetical protein
MLSALIAYFIHPNLNSVLLFTVCAVLQAIKGKFDKKSVDMTEIQKLKDRMDSIAMAVGMKR